MAETPTIYRYHWVRNELVNEAGGAVASRGEYPKIYTGVAEKIIAIQFVQDDENGDLIDYTGLSNVVCNFRVDNDFLNGVGAVGSADWTLDTGAEYKKEIGNEPGLVYINSIAATAGTIGSLAAGEWAFSGRYLYVRLDDSTDPSTKPDNYVQISFSGAAGTPPFIQAESDVWNLTGTWPVYDEGTNSWSYTDPDIEQGQCTFKIAANTFDYVARIGATPQQDCHGQIGIFGTGDDSNYKTFFNQFNCVNVINPEEPPVITPSPYLTITLGDARYVRYGEATMKPFTVSSSELTGRTITITHSLSTLTPFVYVYTDTGEGTGPIKPTVVDADNVTLDFEGFPTTFNDYTVLITGGMYTMPDAIPLTQRGQINGVATLNALGQVPDAQCPDIAVKHMGDWDASTNTPTLSNATGNKGELYVVSVGGSVDLGSGAVTYTADETITHDGTTFDKTTTVLGETSTTAYRGDRGKTAYDHSQIAGNPHLTEADEILADDPGSYFTGTDVEEQLQELGAQDAAWAINFPQPTQFYNNTGVEIPACSWINAGSGGIDAGTGIVKGFLADASVPSLSTSVIGITTAATPDGTVGVAYDRATVPCNTTGLTVGANLYLSETTPGAGTTTRPLHPNTIVILGTIQVVGTSGSVLARVSRFSRAELSRDYGFTSNGIGAGVHDLAGFYDWATTSVTLTQASLTQTYGTVGRTKAAHVGIVPNGPGTVDTGQVGLRVTGTLDSETGSQTASQTAIITDDITTLTANVMAETAEKFSGQVTLELYVVSGTPTTYSLTFNYGYSKYEDFHNKNFTLDEIEATWQGNAADSTFNIEILHHKAAGWTYAATGFTPGDGVIAARLTDQQIESAVANNADGAWKRNQLATYVAGNDSEGIIMRITTGAINTIQNANINLSVLSEDLT